MVKKIKEWKTLLSEETPKKYGVVFCIILFAAILCEILVFNYKWVNSIASKKFEIEPQIISGVLGDTVKSDTAVIEFDEINEKIKYIRFNPGEGKGIKSDIVISAKDEANAQYLSAPKRTVLSDVKASQYIRLHFSGAVKSLKIEIKGMQGEALPEIELNTQVPLMFSWLRLICLVLIVTVIFVLRPGSFLYSYKTDLNVSWQKYTAVLILIAQVVLFWNMIHLNTTNLNWYKNAEHHKQYYSLLESFKEGRLDIGEGSQELKAMENPYDYRARAVNGVDFKWDHAYSDGKYYSYFGVAPALMLYLPYNLMTGNDLPNYMAVFIFGVAVMAGIMLLLKEIIKKWYKNTPFAVYIVLSVIFPWASVIAYAIYKPDFYIVPSIAALMLAIFGLMFWISAEDENRKPVTWRLALGSVCIALTSACRPQFLLTAFFGVMLFWDMAFKKRELFSKNSVKQTIAVCMPFAVIGLAVMWYNFARFGSPFDFGANYNLTTNDMTSRGMVPGRTGLGIFTYFLQPVRFDAVFPFLHDFDAVTTYQGLTLTENLMGGVLALYPVLVIGVFGVFKRKLFNDKREYRFVYLSVIMAVVLAVLDAQMAGLLTRYFTDFVWLLMIAVTFTVLALYNTENKTVSGIVLVLSAVTMISGFLSVFAHTEDAISLANPVAYYTIQHLIAFWM